jgi:hypothetical protein
MVVAFDTCTMDQLRSADVICAIYPANESYHVQLYGQESIARGKSPGSPPHEVKMVEVEVDSTDTGQLLSLIKMVADAKGGLPREVKRKRTSLADWADANAEHWGDQLTSENVDSFLRRSL